MNELDDLMNSLGFNEKNIGTFIETLPFESNVNEIMKSLQNPVKNPFEQWLFFGYIILIAFTTLVSRLFLTHGAVKEVLNALVFGLIYYREVIFLAGKMLSFGISVSILMWVLIGILQYKNEKAY